MSRRKIVVGFGALAAVVSIGAVVFVACSGGSSSCKPGALDLQLGLVDGAQLADTLTVSGDDPGAVVSESFPHTPNQTSPAENFDIAVTWANGYPAYAAVHLTVRAFAAGLLIGSNTETVVLNPSCTSSDLLIGAGVELDDGGMSD